ncbi:MAG: 3'(2'),5'-bisphosphate nucleotidase CysQ [Verrucomicrobiota bacterium]
MITDIKIEDIKEIAFRAGEEILEVYGTEFSVDVKADDSPLTEADRRSNAVIVEALTRLYPEIPVVSEETKTVDYAERASWEYLWMVDPLDGTKEFVKRNGEFTVNIALIRRGAPILGVVYQPVGEVIYWSSAGEGAWKLTGASGEPERLEGGEHYSGLATVRVVASRSHLTEAVEDFVEDLKAQGKSVEFLSAGSSLKLCLVAEGSADVYPRLGPTMEWDTAAAHSVALEAGRQVIEHETTEPLRYNKENLLNPYFLVE